VVWQFMTAAAWSLGCCLPTSSQQVSKALLQAQGEPHTELFQQLSLVSRRSMYLQFKVLSAGRPPLGQHLVINEN
jgi:hypothetical protein